MVGDAVRPNSGSQPPCTHALSRANIDDSWWQCPGCRLRQDTPLVASLSPTEPLSQPALSVAAPVAAQMAAQEEGGEEEGETSPKRVAVEKQSLMTTDASAELRKLGDMMDFLKKSFSVVIKNQESSNRGFEHIEQRMDRHDERFAIV